jgi:hypothetical protein
MQKCDGVCAKALKTAAPGVRLKPCICAIQVLPQGYPAILHLCLSLAPGCQLALTLLETGRSVSCPNTGFVTLDCTFL